MKIIGLSTVAFGFAILMVLFTDVHTEVSFTAGILYLLT
ncbi:MAG: hypothetical protein CM15mP49_01230 [Actinomycetota bacterium]|nr:MAG: hypothetical protein CM15mP49_01230 [Actinomycetota bacterium]